MFYDDERRIGIALFLGLLGEVEFAVLNKEIEEASEVEWQV